MADWLRIKAEYISGCGSMRELAEKHGVSASAIKRRSCNENWVADRTKTEPNVNQKTVRKVIERTSDREADRILRLLAIGDTLTGQLEIAAGELDQQMVKNIVKTKTVEYGEESAAGRPIREVSDEKTEILTVKDALIDRAGLKVLTDALKNLLDASRFAQANREDLTAVQKIMDRLDDDAGKAGSA